MILKQDIANLRSDKTSSSSSSSSTSSSSSSIFSKQNIALLLSITSLVLVVILYLRPSQPTIQSDQIEEFYQVYWDKISFLEHYVAHLSLNLTKDPNAMSQEYKFWRASDELESQLQKLKEEIFTIQSSLKRLQLNHNEYKQDLPKILDVIKENKKHLEEEVDDKMKLTQSQVVPFRWWNYLWYLPIVIAVIVTLVLHYGGFIQIQSPVVIN
eukprot:TRINITY_DN1400_c0_g2_i1.p1 TRINITY_DN1400_c0_g2~~TRINITY_DN1400_c0_g2_i1.p1  ORF type:complete len:212 (-),score=27.73 TRINITY_DN1400_c0_g2_i1:10-645(-)